jgi:predicted aldo/keto reductase-like oxidoreductase
MEPLKGGTLLKLRPEVAAIFKTANPEASLASWAIRYAASLDGIITVKKIQIPKIFEYINEYRVYADIGYAKRRYANITADTGNASDCIACGICENRCPQKLHIIKNMKEATTLLE